MIEKKPFERTRLDEEKETDTREVITISLNKEERAWLEEIKEDLNIKQDGKALKQAAFIGKNVTQALFCRKFLAYLFKKERSKLED